MRSIQVLLVSVSLLAASAAFATTDSACTPVEVGVLFPSSPTTDQRVHIKCSTAVVDGANNIFYFAISWASTDFANRAVSLAATALASGRTLIIRWAAGDNGFNGTPQITACAATNCRKAIAVFLE